MILKATPYSKNAKKHPDSQLKQIAASLKEFGWQQPIVVDKNNEIIVGHGRYFAYQKYPEGIEKPWVQKADKLTPEQVRAYRLADNKLNESDWDMDLAIEELKELDNLGYDISITGFDKDLLIEPDEKDDQIPEDAPTRAKLGDLWLLGAHKVMCGDSTDSEAVERLMDGKKADMVFTDPPYGIDYQDTKGKHKKIENDGKGTDISALLSETLKYNCPAFVCCNWKSYSEFERAMLSNDRNPKSCIVWDKEVRVQNLDKYYKQHEFILYYGLFGGQKTIRGDVWRMKRQVRADHPTAKPVELVATAITDTILPDNIVLDTFLGSGSTLIAAEKTGRICYGMELDPKYVDVILKRWEDYTGNEAVKI